MADERNRWLDRAAAERVLRGGQAVPGADPRAHAAEARLRAALDMLAGPQEPAGAELPGEAAAVAAFRAARAGATAPGASEMPGTGAVPAPAGSDTAPLVELGRIIPLSVPVPAPRRTRPLRFGLVAALAGVAVGGLAVAAGAGLLDRDTHDTAGPVPAVSLSADVSPTPAGDTTGPTPGPELRPEPLRSTDGTAPTPGGGQTQGAGTGAVQGFGNGTGTGVDASGGSADPDAAGGKDEKDGKDAQMGGASSLKDADKQTRLRAVNLCEAYRSGHMTSDRRTRLSKLAQGLSRIPHYCEALLDGPPPRGATPGAPRTSDDGGDVLKAPTLLPASPTVSLPAGRPAH
ncbi:hypothetical protein ACFXA3_02305 [Streptomyces sp. NPDC059456]|uniref:hypothetical protein n=1 Tax=Streptomyces sp. NPDC059456 TaxID=3346838 RepID=UPI0036CAEAC6